MDAAELPAEPGEPAPREPARDGSPGSAAGDGLTDRERDILAFERQFWTYAGAKEHAIRERYEISATRYYQLLNELIDKREALAADPMLVKRLRRLRAGRQRRRAARKLGIERP